VQGRYKKGVSYILFFSDKYNYGVYLKKIIPNRLLKQLTPERFYRGRGIVDFFTLTVAYAPLCFYKKAAPDTGTALYRF
jgi:hypothetical protein